MNTHDTGSIATRGRYRHTQAAAVVVGVLRECGIAVWHKATSLPIIGHQSIHHAIRGSYWRGRDHRHFGWNPQGCGWQIVSYLAPADVQVTVRQRYLC
jgi:hypothetical protein